MALNPYVTWQDNNGIRLILTITITGTQLSKEDYVSLDLFRKARSSSSAERAGLADSTGICFIGEEF